MEHSKTNVLKWLWNLSRIGLSLFYLILVAIPGIRVLFFNKMEFDVMTSGFKESLWTGLLTLLFSTIFIPVASALVCSILLLTPKPLVVKITALISLIVFSALVYMQKALGAGITHTGMIVMLLVPVILSALVLFLPARNYTRQN